MTRGPVAFLFLGETLLIPHLWPIAEALAALAPEVEQHHWVATATHEALIARWMAPYPSMRVRQAPGFRAGPGAAGGEGARPALPPKLPMLARLAPRLWRTPVAVCAEQTSLWLPRMLPLLPTRFVKTAHGAGSMSARDDRRRRAAWRMLVPGEGERAAYLARGYPPDRVVATGYVKPAFRHRTPARALFAEERPVLLYTPHWQPHRSSWPRWGREVVERLVAADRWNLVLAPHQRLVENAPELRDVLARAAGPHVHVDLDSFATVDGSYTAMADLYLGDTSSQLLEYLIRPRPAVFLHAGRAAWAGDPSYAQWRTGEVVERLDELLPALDRAPAVHARYRDEQETLVAAQLGDVTGAGAVRAAEQVLEALAEAR